MTAEDQILAHDLERIDHQEKVLRFKRFDHVSAYRLGTRIKVLAEKKGIALAIEVRLAQQTIYFYAMPGSAPQHADWVRRKRNLVELTHRSSYGIGLLQRTQEVPLVEMMGLSARDHAAFGGGFPIWVKDVGCVGSVTVSGVPQRLDHAIVVEALSQLLSVPLQEVALE